MMTNTDKMVRELLDDAEAQRMFLQVGDDSIADVLNRRVRRGQLFSPHQGVFTRYSYWEKLNPVQRHLHLVETLARIHPEWIFCGPTAALLHGLYVSYLDLDHVHVLGGCTRTVGIVRTLNRQDRAATKTPAGHMATPLLTSAFETMRSMPFRRALGIADSALRVLAKPADRIAGDLGRTFRGRQGITHVSGVLEHANPLSENGGESFARAVMIEEGIQLPNLQVAYNLPHFESKYRVDFDWGIYRHGRFVHVVGELDGYAKMHDPEMTCGMKPPEVMRLERNRESRLTALGIEVARFTFDDCVKVEPLLHTLRGFGIPQANGHLPDVAGGDGAGRRGDVDRHGLLLGRGGVLGSGERGGSHGHCGSHERAGSDFWSGRGL